MLYIKNIFLFSDMNMTDERLFTILNTMGPTLRVHNLYATNVSLTDIESFSLSFPLLEDLNRTFCRNVMNSGLIAFLSKTGRNLRNLNVDCCTNISLSIPHICLLKPLSTNLNEGNKQI